MFLDPKKAFVTVNHGIFTGFDQVKSSLLNSRWLFPKVQSLLFSQFINDLPSSCPEASCQLYADDTVIYTLKKSLCNAAYLTAYLYDVHQWLQHNHLVLNLGKKCVYVFDRIKKFRRPINSSFVFNEAKL